MSSPPIRGAVRLALTVLWAALVLPSAASAQPTDAQLLQLEGLALDLQLLPTFEQLDQPSPPAWYYYKPTWPAGSPSQPDSIPLPPYENPSQHPFIKNTRALVSFSHKSVENLESATGSPLWEKLLGHADFLDSCVSTIQEIHDDLKPASDVLTDFDDLLGSVSHYLDDWTHAPWIGDSTVRRDLRWCVPYMSGGSLFPAKGTRASVGGSHFGIGSNLYSTRIDEAKRIEVLAAGHTLTLFGKTLPLIPTPSPGWQIEGLQWLDKSLFGIDPAQVLLPVDPDTLQSLSVSELFDVHKYDWSPLTWGRLFPVYSPKPWPTGFTYSASSPQYAGLKHTPNYPGKLYLDLFAGPDLDFAFDFSPYIPAVPIVPPLVLRFNLETGFGFKTQSNTTLDRFLKGIYDGNPPATTAVRDETVQAPDVELTNGQDFWLRVGGAASIGFNVWRAHFEASAGITTRVGTEAVGGFIDYHNNYMDHYFETGPQDPQGPCKGTYVAEPTCDNARYGSTRIFRSQAACEARGLCTYRILVPVSPQFFLTFATNDLTEAECGQAVLSSGGQLVSYQPYQWGLDPAHPKVIWSGSGCHPIFAGYPQGVKDAVKAELRDPVPAPRYTVTGFSRLEASLTGDAYVRILAEIRIFRRTRRWERSKSWRLFDAHPYVPQRGVQAKYDLDLWPGHAGPADTVTDFQPAQTRWRGYELPPSSPLEHTTVDQFLSECFKTLPDLGDIPDPRAGDIADFVCVPSGDPNCPIGWTDRDKDPTTGLGGCEHECKASPVAFGVGMTRELWQEYGFCFSGISLENLQSEMIAHPEKLRCRYAGFPGTFPCVDTPRVRDNAVDTLMPKLGCYSGPQPFSSLFTANAPAFDLTYARSPQARAQAAAALSCFDQRFDESRLEVDGEITVCKSPEPVTELPSVLVIGDGTPDVCHAIAPAVTGPDPSRLCFQVPRACTPAPSGAIAWWPFDEVNRTAVTDRIGLRTGALSGGARTRAGLVQGALSLDGTGGYVEVAQGSRLDLGKSDFSLAVWVRAQSQPGVKVILDKRSAGHGYELYLYNGTLGIQLADGGYTNYGSGVRVADGRWHHVAVTVHRNQPNGIVWYVDGAEAGARRSPTDHAGSLDNGSPLRIGSLAVGLGGFFGGDLDELQIFSRALEPEEVKGIYEAGASGVCKCPDSRDPRVHYLSRDPLFCATQPSNCLPGQIFFSNSCGCGHIDPIGDNS